MANSDDNRPSTAIDEAPTPPRSTVTNGPWGSTTEPLIKAVESSIKALTAATENLVKSTDNPKLNGTGGGGGDMENRIKSLEDKMTDVKVSVGKIETRLDQIERNMITKGYAAVIALCVVIACGGSVLGGGWWLIQQYLGPILKSLPH